MAIQKANKLLNSTTISRKLCVRKNYTAHMHKQKAAFVRLGRSLGIFSLKCKSTLQRCPKKVTIIIWSICRHVHVPNSCTQFMFMQSLFFASCAQTRRPREEQNVSKPCTHFFTMTITHQSTTAPKNTFRRQPTWPSRKQQNYCTAQPFPESCVQGTELRSTHAQTECSVRQTGAVTWHLLTEMQKHSPKVS